MRMVNGVSQIVDSLKRAANQGMFEIILSTFLVKVSTFLIIFLLPKILSKTGYGVLSYVDNLRTYLLLVDGLGMVNATLKFGTIASKNEEKTGVLITTTIIGIIIDLFIIGVVYIIINNVKFAFPEAKRLLEGMLFLQVLTFIFDNAQSFFRSLFKNRIYSLVGIFYASLLAVLVIFCASYYGIYGVIYARYIAVLISLVIIYIILLKMKIFKKGIIFLSQHTVKNMFKFSTVVMLSNMMSLIMPNNELFIIGYVIKDVEIIAEYKVASMALSIGLLLYSSIIMFIYPYFLKHSDDKRWIWNAYKKIIKINAVVMIPVHLCLIIFARPFILLFYGENYINAISIMRVLFIASLVQALLRGVASNVLIAIGSEMRVLKINAVFVIIHIILDFIAVSFWGINGAAISLVLIYLVSGGIMSFSIRKICLQ